MDTLHRVSLCIQIRTYELRNKHLINFGNNYFLSLGQQLLDI